MALYYFNISVLTKNKHSAVAKAAYTTGESLYSERDLETKSYKKREEQPESFILAPKNAPEWVNDREKLWNEVEKIENRYNSQIAKEIKVALPIELENEKQTELLLEFVNENIVSRGIVADVSIHRDRKENPHAHILITTRPFNDDGTWGNKKKREYVFDEKGDHVLDKNGKKSFLTIPLTDWDKKDTLIEWRRSFAEKINEHYLKNGVEQSVSHESYEKQGIDKLPKQRLSRGEYEVERKAKEQAEKIGQEYKPVTHYGALNSEIENANKKLEIINQKVVSLSEYKKHVENEKYKELQDIRKNYNLSEQDWKSLKVVGKRVNGFVDIQNAKDNLDKLANWKKKIDYVERLLKAEEKVLAKAKLTHQRDVSKTLVYGFIPNKFEKEFSEAVNTFKGKLETHEKSLGTFQELYEHSIRAYEIQKEFTNEEFNFLYPQYSETFNESNDSAIELKAKYIELFKVEGTARKVIPEIENEAYKYTDDHVKLKGLLQDWKEVKNSLVILERTSNKKRDEVKEHYNTYDAKKLYKAQILYADVREQIEGKEQLKVQLQSSLDSEMLVRYPNVSNETINNIPPEVKSRLLELHLTGENTGELSQDLRLVQAQQKERGSYRPDGRSEEQGTESLSKDSGALFNALIGMAQSQEAKHDDLEEQRKRKKKQNKLYRELGEQEM